MNVRWILIGSLTAITLSLTFATAGAKAPIGRITIDGPNQYADVEITDLTDLHALGEGVFFFNVRSETEQITQALERGYLFTRFLDFGVIDGVRRFEPFDQLLYYPDPAGGTGFVYYLGMVSGNTEYDGRFYRISAKDDATVRQILEKYGLSPATPGGGPAPGLPHFTPGSFLAWLSAGLVGAAAGWVLGQRQVRRREQAA